VSDGSQQATIRCPIGLFDEQDARMAALTEGINQASTPSEKAPWAKEIIEAADVLLECEAYDQGSKDCRLCRGFADLRRRTAALVLKVAEVAR
jgi:Mor family transcriptional regulator